MDSMFLRLLSTALLLPALASAAPSSLPIRLATPPNILATNDSTSLRLYASLAAVCKPTECIPGANSLAGASPSSLPLAGTSTTLSCTAGVTILTPVNTNSRATVLLPGAYTSSSASVANSSLLTFSSSSTFETDAGFSTSGSLGSTFTVSLRRGLTAYSAPLFEGTAAYTSLANASSLNSTSTTSTVESFLVSNNVWAILNVGGSSGGRVVAWDGLADIGNMVSGSGGVSIVQIQGTGCSTPCASGGVCAANSTCACSPGFAGATCNACTASFFGKPCEACPVGCTNCDDSITGTARCLDSTAANATLTSACDFSNAVCASASSTATCACNAGWMAAANGTQCAACATGYFASAGGDCLACDPSCESCSGSSGTCITCQAGLQPHSTYATKCTTATTATTNGTTATTNGTFVTCADRTYIDSKTSACVNCNPLGETCWTMGTGGCLSCRSTNAPLNGECVALNVCDSAGVVQDGTTSAVGSNAGWVFDNTRAECDGSSVSADGLSCVTCDSSCSTFSGSTSSDCTTCTDTSKRVLNGRCISGPSCPTGYFTPPTDSSTCLACHPDCDTCGTTFDTCLTCPSTHPVLSSASTCLLTCSSSEYFDTAKGACIACSSECATCSGAGSEHCLSCSSTTTLKSGTCSATEGGCTVVAGFGVCLSSLVTVVAVSTSSPPPPPTTTSAKVQLPWYIILAIVIVAHLESKLGGGKRRKLEAPPRSPPRVEIEEGVKVDEVKEEEDAPLLQGGAGAEERQGRAPSRALSAGELSVGSRSRLMM